MKTVAFVPLRLNSQRVAGKNLRLLGGEPLMCHILRTLARQSGRSTRCTPIAATNASCEYLPRRRAFPAPQPRPRPRRRRSGGRSTTVFTRRCRRPTSTCWRTPPRPSSDRKPLPTHRGGAAQGHRRGATTRRSAPSGCRPLHGTGGEPLNYALDDDPPHAGPSSRSIIETSAFFIFRRARSGAACGSAASAEKPYMAVVDRIEGLGHRLPRGFRAGRGNRKTAEQIIVAGRRSAKIRITFIADATHLRPVSP